MAIPTCAEARKIDLVSYLSSLGYHPIRIKGSDHWYYSPFRKERTASFKVNRSMNVFYDHGSGQGGNIIDFGIIYHKLNVAAFLQILAEDFVIHPGNNNHIPLFKTESHSKTSGDKSGIVIADVRKLSDKSLLDYFQQRRIDLDIAVEFCKEIEFTVRNKKQVAIGFANDKGGYELRNAYFKGSSSPKTSSFFDNGKTVVTVFEGFFNFLSYLTIEQDNPYAITNYLVLNSLSFFQKAREKMEAHLQINLQLDRDHAGTNCTIVALKSHPAYFDQSKFYEGHKDLNEWLIATNSSNNHPY
ncbi:CHC2 zinc finger domain-containing protein [Chitinophagaceae bacterium 26-R-25]|nr:CHC2 zinc finger domain-containing protein [Chitinophagaceae bacterium 26-R-25]